MLNHAASVKVAAAPTTPLILIREAMNKPVMVDLRNVYPPEEAARHGFAYTGIGRALDPAS